MHVTIWGQSCILKSHPRIVFSNHLFFGASKRTAFQIFLFSLHGFTWHKLHQCDRKLILCIFFLFSLVLFTWSIFKFKWPNKKKIKKRSSCKYHLHIHSYTIKRGKHSCLEIMLGNKINGKERREKKHTLHSEYFFISVRIVAHAYVHFINIKWNNNKSPVTVNNTQKKLVNKLFNLSKNTYEKKKTSRWREERLAFDSSNVVKKKRAHTPMECVCG